MKKWWIMRYEILSNEMIANQIVLMYDEINDNIIGVINDELLMKSNNNNNNVIWNNDNIINGING